MKRNEKKNIIKTIIKVTSSNYTIKLFKYKR
jgi:hypothetical protein